MAGSVLNRWTLKKSCSVAIMQLQEMPEPCGWAQTFSARYFPAAARALPQSQEQTRFHSGMRLAARSSGICGRSCREGANRPNCEAYGSVMTSQTVGFGVGRKPRSIFSLSAFAK